MHLCGKWVALTMSSTLIEDPIRASGVDVFRLPVLLNLIKGCPIVCSSSPFSLASAYAGAWVHAHMGDKACLQQRMVCVAQAHHVKVDPLFSENGPGHRLPLFLQGNDQC